MYQSRDGSLEIFKIWYDKCASILIWCEFFLLPGSERSFQALEDLFYF
jgi:hypothetical protein